MANFVAMVGPIDQLWLPHMVPLDYLWHHRLSNAATDGLLVTKCAFNEHALSCRRMVASFVQSILYFEATPP